MNIEVPTKTSALENDSGYATTEDVVEKVNGAGHLKAVPVDALPAPSEANADTIYFLRKNNSEAGKQYRAYKLIHGIFEIGRLCRGGPHQLCYTGKCGKGG